LACAAAIAVNSTLVPLVFWSLDAGTKYRVGDFFLQFWVSMNTVAIGGASLIALVAHKIRKAVVSVQIDTGQQERTDAAKRLMLIRTNIIRSALHAGLASIMVLAWPWWRSQFAAILVITLISVAPLWMVMCWTMAVPVTSSILPPSECTVHHGPAVGGQFVSTRALRSSSTDTPHGTGTGRTHRGSVRPAPVLGDDV